MEPQGSVRVSPVRGLGGGSRREAARPGWFCAGRGYIRGASLQHRAPAGVAAQQRLMCCSQRANFTFIHLWKGWKSLAQCRQVLPSPWHCQPQWLPFILGAKSSH